MLPFILGLFSLVVANLLTNHELQREGFNELKGGVYLGS